MKFIFVMCNASSNPSHSIGKNWQIWEAVCEDYKVYSDRVKTSEKGCWMLKMTIMSCRVLHAAKVAQSAQWETVNQIISSSFIDFFRQFIPF